MKMNGDNMKKYVKYGINATSILDATIKNWVISAFTV